MSKILTLLIASTALTATVALPAWSTMVIPQLSTEAAPVGHVVVVDQDQPQLWLVNDDNDDNEDGDVDDDGDDDGCEDGKAGCKASQTPAPAGNVAPPQNGLFGTGTAPKVQLN